MKITLTKETLLRNTGRLLLELVIVFLGVYFAFQLNNYKEELASRKTKKNYYRLILRDFEVLQREVQGQKKQISQHLEKFEQAVADGHRPQVVALKSLDMTTNMMIIRSAFSSGYLENLDPNYVSNLSNGSNQLTRVSNFMNNYNAEVTRALNAFNYKSTHFYAADGTLLPEYSWIIDDLRNIEKYLTSLNQAIEAGAIPDTRRLIGE